MSITFGSMNILKESITYGRRPCIRAQISYRRSVIYLRTVFILKQMIEIGRSHCCKESVVAKGEPGT